MIIIFSETLPRFIHAKTLSKILMRNEPQKRNDNQRERYKSSVICRHIGTHYAFSSSSNCSLNLDVYIIHLFKTQQLADSRD